MAASENGRYPVIRIRNPVPSDHPGFKNIQDFALLVQSNRMKHLLARPRTDRSNLVSDFITRDLPDDSTVGSESDREALSRAMHNVMLQRFAESFFTIPGTKLCTIWIERRDYFTPTTVGALLYNDICLSRKHGTTDVDLDTLSRASLRESLTRSVADNSRAERDFKSMKKIKGPHGPGGKSWLAQYNHPMTLLSKIAEMRKGYEGYWD